MEEREALVPPLEKVRSPGLDIATKSLAKATKFPSQQKQRKVPKSERGDKLDHGTSIPCIHMWKEYHLLMFRSCEVNGYGLKDRYYIDRTIFWPLFGVKGGPGRRRS